MKPKELAAFDEGKYNRRATTPRESARISRDNRLVTLVENNATKKANPTTPEHSILAAEISSALKVIGSIPRACAICGRYLAKGVGVVILNYDGEDVPEASARCPMCFDALKISLKPEDPFSRLSVLHKKIWDLLSEGLTESQIAARLTNGTQRVTQQMVSEVKLKIRRQINESRRTGYGSRLQ